MHLNWALHSDMLCKPTKNVSDLRFMLFGCSYDMSTYMTEFSKPQCVVL